jgi:hypothetical protein
MKKKLEMMMEEQDNVNWKRRQHSLDGFYASFADTTPADPLQPARTPRQESLRGKCKQTPVARNRFLTKTTAFNPHFSPMPREGNNDVEHVINKEVTKTTQVRILELANF